MRKKLTRCDNRPPICTLDKASTFMAANAVAHKTIMPANFILVEYIEKNHKKNDSRVFWLNCVLRGFPDFETFNHWPGSLKFNGFTYLLLNNSLLARRKAMKDEGFVALITVTSWRNGTTRTLEPFYVTIWVLLSSFILEWHDMSICFHEYPPQKLCRSWLNKQNFLFRKYEWPSHEASIRYLL